MNGDAFEPRDKTDNRIRWHRLAALGEPCHQLVDTHHQDTAAARLGAASRGVHLGHRRFRHHVKQTGRLPDRNVEFARIDFGAADCGKKFILRFEARFMRKFVVVERGLPVPLQFLFDNGAAVRQCLLRIERVKPLPHFAARTVAAQVTVVRTQPVARWATLFHRDDVNALSIFKRGGQRHHHAIHFGTAATMPEPGVHGVGKINRRRILRQIDDLALGRQHKNRLFKQRGLESGEELSR